MSLSLIPVEQLAAEFLTAAAISVGASTPAVKYQRAQAALSVASVFQQAGQGNIAAASQALTTLASGISDPGLATAVQGLISVGQPFLSAEGAALAATPLLGITVEGALTNVAAGMTAVASKYPAPAAT
jgi:hypothetical protein